MKERNPPRDSLFKKHHQKQRNKENIGAKNLFSHFYESNIMSWLDWMNFQPLCYRMHF